MSQAITEKMNVHEEWYQRAKKVTIDTLPEFIKSLTENYSHDYGTICHALAAAAIGAAHAVNNSEAGGITGFQSGAVMWEFIRNWQYSNNKTGLKIVDYDNFLYPQYKYKYDKVISKDTWEAVQKEAKENIKKANKEQLEYLSDLETYEKDISVFIKKYPDYITNKKFYDRLGIGTGHEWEAERLKEESGFEFAPKEPYEPVNSNSAVYRHWVSILNGHIPFGYHLED